MATASKKPAKGTTAIAKWDAALAARAKLSKKTVENVGSAGEWISFKGGQITFKDQVVGNKLEVVIPSFVLENAYYEGKYDPNNPASPVCFAFGQEEEGMAPHEKSSSPQHETCEGCPMNEWESDPEGGRGKACKNQVRFAALPAEVVDGDADAVAGIKEAYAKVPITSVKAWASFINEISAVDKPPLAFVTEITVTPDPKSQFKVSFKAKEEIPAELIGAMIDRADALDKVIGFPYMPNEERAEPARRPARGGAKPAASRPSAKRAPAAHRPAAAPAAAAGKRRKF